ncbi:MAG: Uroporphyrinogen decarboxylase [Verrucomicrobiae bacterium]|nr:Uroporphyrinogen decarboxylase [Verrucomicrobiae bacterium]
MTGRNRILALLAGQPTDRLPAMPITMMFAAAYAGLPYRDYATNFRLLADAQIRVADAFDIDHLNVMSDPACEAADCGAAVVFSPDQPPALDETNALLQDKTKLAHLKLPEPTAGRMGNRLKVLEIYQQRRSTKLVEGWIEGPCAEGADLRGINTLMLDFYDDPSFVRDLFAFCNTLELAFAKEQITRGAELIGVGDAAASLVGPEIYREFVWPFEKQLVDGLHALGAKVRLHICGNITASLADVGRLGCDIVDLDFMVPVDQARQAMGDRQVLLGNIDPVRIVKNGTPASVTAAIAECHRQAGQNFILGAGCEIPRGTPPENLLAFTRYHP